MEQAEEIRRLYSTGRYTQVALATQFNVSKAVVFKIVHNESWVPENIDAIAREIDFCAIIRDLIVEIDETGAPSELRTFAERAAREYRAP
jgi:hypothetical protein